MEIMTTTEEFWLWVEREMNAIGLSFYQLERDAGVGNATVSRPAREWREPTLTVCQAIATGLRVPLEHVLRKAGHLPPGKEETDPRLRATAEQLIAIWNRIKYLDPDSLDALLNIVVTQAEMVEAAANAARRNDNTEERIRTKI